jgi:hypothetical protein
MHEDFVNRVLATAQVRGYTVGKDGEVSMSLAKLSRLCGDQPSAELNHREVLVVCEVLKTHPNYLFGFTEEDRPPRH